MCGYTGAGKSSLSKVIAYRSDWYRLYSSNDPLECITGVIPLTAGIEPYIISSHFEIDNVILYDFSGHPEFYSSHTAVLETLMLSTSAVFVIVSNLKDTPPNIKKQLLYWCNFIETVSRKASSHVIVAGSHVDEISGDGTEFNSLINDTVQQMITTQTYKGFIPVDCHRPRGKGIYEFMSVLRTSCRHVLDRSRQVHFYHHIQYSFLRDLKQMIALTVDEFRRKLKELNDPSFCPSDPSFVMESLKILSQLNLIMLLPNEDILKRWIIIDQEALLKDINGVLFAPSSIERVHQQNISSNTGIISKPTLSRIFPKYNVQMLIGFLTSLQFCQVIEGNILTSINTNISSIDDILSEDSLLFFPSLINIECPSNVTIKPVFGWSIYCSNPHQEFSNRFLHVLLLALALKYAFKKDTYGDVEHETSSYQRLCDVWKNGIYWSDIGIDILVELSDHNRCLTLLTSKTTPRSQDIVCSIIEDIFHLLNKLCPCKYQQYLISPNQLSNIRTIPVSDRTVCTIQDIAKIIKYDEDQVYDVKRKQYITVCELFGGFDRKVNIYLYLNVNIDFYISIDNYTDMFDSIEERRTQTNRYILQ